jgi:ParB/RepB/Spo0J family partition protein
MPEVLAFCGLAIVYMALSQLSPDPKNPRRHSAWQIKQIARSIAAFGFVVPLLIDRHNRIVAGHGRYLAAQLLGMDVVPVIRLEHLTEAQAKALRIADNRLTERSLWL